MVHVGQMRPKLGQTWPIWSPKLAEVGRVWAKHWPALGQFWLALGCRIWPTLTMFANMLAWYWPMLASISQLWAKLGSRLARSGLGLVRL